MNAIAIIISLIALVGAGFAFLRASSSHRILTKRIEKQKERITVLEERLRRLEGNASRGGKKHADDEEQGRRNKPRQEQQEQVREREQPRERDQNREREAKQKKRDRREQDQRQPQEVRQQQDDQQIQHQSEDAPQGQQRGRRNRDRRRGNEPRDTATNPEQAMQEPRAPQARYSEQGSRLEFAEGDLLAELEEQAAGGQRPEPMEQTVSVQPTPVMEQAEPDKKYAVIPEDGLIRHHQLQLQPDSDSYIEVDTPAVGSNSTRYRFNLSGNQAFVISQGIDRLENAFAFEKPSNRMVSRIVQQGDGILTRAGNGWKIEEKARIDFR